MTKRTCPWCGGSNLRISNVSGESVYWKDGDCGYREITTHAEYYDYSIGKMIPIVPPYQVKSFIKPKSPLPIHQQPEYLRGKLTVPNISPGQQKIGVET